ncbi:hypothetical protein D0Y65_002078 [Glycine soja]|uniref:Uncharacterized protein n=1 Tax=Glycine soja TaxID=3848 RepID=A0A445M5S7_GLYSO|nr:hypothetical protein D0Y65_002078 [Glycine soja]
MELLSLRLTPSPSSSTSSLLQHLLTAPSYVNFSRGRRRRRASTRLGLRCGVLKASAERTGDTIDDGEARSGFTTPAMEVTTFNRSTFSDAADFPVWEKIGAVVRLSYGIAQEVKVSEKKLLSSIKSMNFPLGKNGNFDFVYYAILEGLGYAAPPIMALLFILDDEVVKLSPHARAIRDVEDEELWAFSMGVPLAGEGCDFLQE